MMNMSNSAAVDLMARLRKGGAALWEENGKLRYRAPQGVLSEDDLRALKEHKENILLALQAEADPAAVVAAAFPESRFEPFPLTDVQSAYLLGRSEAFGYGGVACHIYLEINYPELDRERVEKIWNKLIARHDMLRATIDRNGYQQVADQAPRFSVTGIDASAWDADRTEARLNDVRESMGHRVYDPGSWPLFDIAVTRTAERAVLHFSIEFLIADWASIWLLLSEFERMYADEHRVLPELRLTFRDYLLAERSLREGAAYTRDKQYWLSRIEDLPPAPDLPAARRSSEPAPARFSRRYLRLNADAWNGFKRRAQQRGITPTTAVLAAYAAVIERWSRSRSFCLNLTVLNRLPLHPQVGDIVGDFTSISLLAVDWNSGRSFGERAKAINGQLFEDLDHRLFSGVEVLREISRRKGREAALMPIVFTSAIGLAGQTEGSGLIGQVEGQGISQTPQVFIDCQAMDRETGLQVNWDIREGVFPEGMTDDMFAAFEALLRQLAEADRHWEESESVELPVWQMDERSRINSTAMPLPTGTLHGGVFAQAAADPRRIAIIDGEEQVTYGELARRAAGIAARLQGAGCGKGDRVAVAMEKSAQQAAAVLGVLALGAAYVPIDPAQPTARRTAILEKTQVRHLLTGRAIRTEWPENVETIEIDRIKPLEREWTEAESDADLPAYIIHTSGSTGQPKGVVITHRAAVNTIHAINGCFDVGPEDTALGLAQLGFDLSVYDLFGVLSAGGTLVYPAADRQTDPSHWAELIVRHRVTIWNSVPAMMQMLLAYWRSEPGGGSAKLRLVLLSGDWIPLHVPDSLAALAPSAQLVCLGGATEASIWSNYHIYQGLHPNWSSIPYGRPLPNQSFRVLDGQLRDCPVWVPGELYIGGEGLADGYFGDRQTTEASFFPHPSDGQRLYRTGDIGRYMPGGEIEFLGREDNQVKIRGHRIELGEIEAALQKHPAVASAAVVAVGSGDDKALFGAVETVPGQSVRAAELIELQSGYLPGYMVVAELRIVSALPLTGNGKVDRKEISEWRLVPDSFVHMAEESGEIGDSLERELSQVWAEALGLPAIGRADNFYSRGADSLIMAQVSGKLREGMSGEPSGSSIPFDALLRQMLNYPTVAALAEFVRSHSGRAGDRPAAEAAAVRSRGASGNAALASYGGGTAGPLRVVFHAGLGTMNDFRLLLAHLDKQQAGPVIGITVADASVYCSARHDELIERLADDYAKRLIETGHARMQLIGYSLGGVIAAETARRLLETGIEIVDLALIESHPVPYAIDDDLVTEALFATNLNLSLEQVGFSGVHPDDLHRGLRKMFEDNNQSVPAGASLSIGGDEGLDRVGELFRRLSQITARERFTAYVDAIAGLSCEKMPVEMAESLFQVFRQSLKAARFTPRPYMGDMRLLLAKEPFALLPGTKEATLGFWREICLGDLTVEEIEGNHLTSIAVEPNASALAGLLGQALAAAGGVLTFRGGER